MPIYPTSEVDFNLEDLRHVVIQELVSVGHIRKDRMVELAGVGMPAKYEADHGERGAFPVLGPV